MVFSSTDYEVMRAAQEFVETNIMFRGHDGKTFFPDKSKIQGWQLSTKAGVLEVWAEGRCCYYCMRRVCDLNLLAFGIRELVLMTVGTKQEYQIGYGYDGESPGPHL